MVVDLNALNEDEFSSYLNTDTPLKAAVCAGLGDITAVLLAARKKDGLSRIDMGAVATGEALNDAVRDGRFEIAKNLIEAGACQGDLCSDLLTSAKSKMEAYEKTDAASFEKYKKIVEYLKPELERNLENLQKKLGELKGKLGLLAGSLGQLKTSLGVA